MMRNLESPNKKANIQIRTNFVYKVLKNLLGKSLYTLQISINIINWRTLKTLTIDEKTVLKYCFIETEENRRVVSRAKEERRGNYYLMGRIPVLKR